MMSQEQKIGLCGQNWVCDRISSLGLRCQQMPDFMNPGYDLLVEGRLPVEVKYARRTIRRVKNRDGSISSYWRWQWDVASVNGLGGTCLILVADDQGMACYSFIMPAWIMADRSHFQITSHPIKYKGLIADFFGKWDVIKFMLRKGWAKGEPGPWAEVSHD